MKVEDKIFKIKINEIKPYKQNAKKHPDKQIDAIIKSIQEYGFNVPLILDNKKEIICGHGRYLAAQKMGVEELPCILKDDLTPAQVKAFRIADNKVTESDWDYEFLKLEFEELKFEFEDFNLDLTGFDDAEIDKFCQNDIIEDEIPPVPETPRTVKGDIYQLGNHRIMCGDSTLRTEVEKLMAGKLSDMIHTDPPYNVSYGKSKIPDHTMRQIKNDTLDAVSWEKFCKALFAIFKEFNKGDIYMWGASGPEGMKMRLWLIGLGCHWSSTIIWKKDTLVISRSNYQRMYEPCFYGWFNKSSFEADRKEVEVWDIKRPTKSELHPTMKPVELCAKAINNSSKFRDTVLDLFLGSGSTLIACEQTNRTCYGMEIDEKYCDVIVSRWVNLTGNRKIILNGQNIEWEIAENL